MKIDNWLVAWRRSDAINKMHVVPFGWVCRKWTGAGSLEEWGVEMQSEEDGMAGACLICGQLHWRNKVHGVRSGC